MQRQGVLIQAVYQNPRNLILGVVAGSLDMPLSVLRHESYVLDLWTLKFCIIGESHFVAILRDGVPVLSEVLACVDISAKICEHHHRFDDLSPHCFAQSGYKVSVTFEQYPQKYNPDDLLTNRTVDGGIEMKFPKMHGHTPITRIEWTKISDSQIEWQTLHVYPQAEDVICVRSLSVFDGLNYNKNP